MSSGSLRGRSFAQRPFEFPFAFSAILARELFSAGFPLRGRRSAAAVELWAALFEECRHAFVLVRGAHRGEYGAALFG